MQGGISAKIPGALGLLIRSKTYARSFKHCGTNVVFGRNVRIYGADRIILGKNVIVDDNCIIDASKGTQITIDDGVYVGRNTRIVCRQGSIFIANSTNISANCLFSSDGRLVIGHGVMVAGFVKVTNEPEKGRADFISAKDNAMSLHIGNNCWIGSHATILEGSDVGDNVTIGAGAVVKGTIAPNHTVVGNPARYIIETA